MKNNLVYLDLDQDEVYQLIKHYGTLWSTYKCMEEPAELIQAISKITIAFNEGESDLLGYRDALQEEMADVFITIKLLQELYNISNRELQAHINQKMKRNIGRITQDNGNNDGNTGTKK